MYVGPLKRALQFLVREKILSALLVMFVVVSFVSKSFLTFGNINNLFVQIGLYGIVALGMTFAIIGGDFDLGAGSMVSCASILVALMLPRMPMVLAIALTIACALASGFLNGVLVAHAKINSFIVTFGSMIMLKGIALSLGGGKPISTYAANDFNAIATGSVCGLSLIFIVFSYCSVFATGCCSIPISVGISTPSVVITRSLRARASKSITIK